MTAVVVSVYVIRSEHGHSISGDSPPAPTLLTC
jgi:hypothetical protein